MGAQTQGRGCTRAVRSPRGVRRGPPTGLGPAAHPSGAAGRRRRACATTTPSCQCTARGAPTTGSDLPKGTEITGDRDYLAAIAAEINDRPQILDWHKPAEKLALVLADAATACVNRDRCPWRMLHETAAPSREVLLLGSARLWSSGNHRRSRAAVGSSSSQP